MTGLVEKRMNQNPFAKEPHAPPRQEGGRNAWAPRGFARASMALLAGLLAIGALGAPRGNSPNGEHANCRTCHSNHHAPGAALTRKPATEDLCDSCHQSQAETGIQNPNPQAPVQIPPWKGMGSSHYENYLALKKGQPYTRVVTGAGHRVYLRTGCDGCHDPHARGPAKLREVAFDAQGRLVATGSPPARAAMVCFGCHAGEEAVRLRNVRDGSTDLGRLFVTGIPSSHFMGQRASDRPDLPSLNGTAFKERLDCTSCHNAPDGALARGPHVSPYDHLLSAPYGTESDGDGGSRSGELCYTCHSRASIEANQSFPYHRQHIEGFMEGASHVARTNRAGRDEGSAAPGAVPRRPGDRKAGRTSFMAGVGQPTPCATCHDPHGSLKYSALIAFDSTVVKPSSVGGPGFLRTSAGHGSCTLSCHGRDHIHATY